MSRYHGLMSPKDLVDANAEHLSRDREQDLKEGTWTQVDLGWSIGSLCNRQVT